MRGFGFEYGQREAVVAAPVLGTKQEDDKIATLLRERGRLMAGREVLVIDQDDEKKGPMLVEDAKRLAKEAGLDLVLVADRSDPPVCRIMDYGKLQYERKKKLREQKKHHHAQKLKEVKFRLRIDQHDYDYKIQHAADFLGKGDKVKVSLMFRGREMAHKDMGFELMKRVIEDLAEYGKAESMPRMMGRSINVMIVPVKRTKSGAVEKEKNDDA